MEIIMCLTLVLVHVVNGGHLVKSLNWLAL